MHLGLIQRNGSNDPTAFKVHNMARKIFYARRSKRPFLMVFGLLCVGAVFFCAGFEAGRMDFDFMARTNAVAPVNLMIAER